jgi:hypothetical protein
VPVPDDIFHRAAFLGALATLGHWTAWQRDPLHKAAKVAGVWQRIADNLKSQPCDVERQLTGGVLEDCAMRLRISPDNSCIIQCFDECAQTWGDWFDVSQCAPGAVSQPGPGGTPDVGSEHCYDTVITGNSQWISPIPIQDGDTVTISGVGGGWFDGAGWYCPNGQSYVLGGCSGAGGLNGGDPAPTLNHASLIASTDGGSSWQSGYNTSPTILAGQTATNLLLQMNDASLGDNGGSIHLKVCIKHEAVSTWVMDFDFLSASGGWTPVATHGSWVNAVGWTSDPVSNRDTCYLQFPFTTQDFILTKAEMTTQTTAAPAGYAQAGIAFDGAPAFLVSGNAGYADTPGGTLSFVGSISPGSYPKMNLALNINNANTDPNISHAHFEGTGHNPFLP